jgi:hypothetical protein
MYCYITMPFGLRNAGTTYQRCMNHVFGDHIGRTVEAYVDDIVVGAKAKTLPFARCLRQSRCTNGDKTTGRLHPLSHASQDEGL